MISEPGESMDHIYENSVIMDSIDDAEDMFVVSKDRLLDACSWETGLNEQIVTFYVVDKHGREHKRKVHTGDILIATPLQYLGKPAGFEITHIIYDDYPDAGTEVFSLEFKNHNLPVDAWGIITVGRKFDKITVSIHTTIDTQTENNVDFSTLFTTKFWKPVIDNLIVVS